MKRDSNELIFYNQYFLEKSMNSEYSHTNLFLNTISINIISSFEIFHNEYENRFNEIKY
jgi:hypothetical protein